MAASITLLVNGQAHSVQIDPRTSLLDALRERLDLTGTKKGCDQGGCGACTVLLDDRRVLSCLTLAVQADGRPVTTIEGVAHPLQDAIVEADGLQCGYCTPGQVCSALGMLAEHRAGAPSHVTADVASHPPLDRQEIRERMSGNLCRCGAHNGIVEAIEAVASDAKSEAAAS
ncbi:(2Fe-2S)-binding protein [Demetria terragena]|uniref:(2Fe-2S)-binding protein n=1 Tax=Demetria terragena TaxID=63959 RepID=UPI000371D01E|nr:2Fe-2S iron-sulfur cluster-binding protein [Demetria terragena]